MIISKITRQKKMTDRYNIFTKQQGKDVYAFSIDEAVLLKYNLRRGMELDRLLLSEIEYQDDISKGYQQAVQYLAKMKRTEAEVSSYLTKKMENEMLVVEVIQKLHHLNFLDDEDYAYSYVRTQRNTTNKGIEVIKRELKEKGVAQHLIDGAMQEITYDDQLLSAQKIASKWLDSKKKDSNRMLLQKLEQALVRKGFTSEIIQEIKQAIEEEAPEGGTEEWEKLRIQGEKAKRKYEKLPSFECQMKMKQFLYRKGFPLELIERFLQEIETDE